MSPCVAFRARSISASAARIHVLVVDDDPLMRKALSILLRREGHHVAVAADAEEGLALARAERPDLIVLDLSMPAIDGLGMLYVLRHEEAFERIPVVISSASADDEQTMSLVRGLGVDAVVDKCDDIGVLLANVRRLLVGRHACTGPLPG